MKIKSVVAVLLFSSLVLAQNENYSLHLSGNLQTDSKIVLAEYSDNVTLPNLVQQPVDKKSPILAGLFSAVIPGAGQAYNGDFWKTAIFVALEAGLITTAVIYNNKGDDKTSEFENYADNVTDNSGWSVVKYAEWLAEYEGADYNKIVVNDNTNLPPWERVNWVELNAAEKGSHKLPPHGDQQYYELIGKYHQYSSGWWDYSGGANNSQISPSFSFYSGMRGDANSYYNVSDKAVIGIYINHLLSAVEAVWSAVSFNKNITVSARVENEYLADGVKLIPTLKIGYRFSSF